MDHIKLTPYPFAESVVVPRLMPFQELPFNGDGYLAAEFIRLRDKYNIKWAFETGTCLGSTTMWMKDNFEHVASFESNEQFYAIAKARVDHYEGDHHVYLRESVQGISEFSGLVPRGERAIYFLDAHWGPNCPLTEELRVISRTMRTPPVIIIHDFLVPEKDFGYDRTPDGMPFDSDLIDPWLGDIYVDCKAIRKNYPTKVEGARRGWISIEPA